MSAHGSLSAIDLDSGKVIWHVDGPKDSCQGRPTPPCNNSYLTPATVVGDVVLAGNTDGFLRAYAREDGHLVWAFDTVREYQGTNDRKGNGGSLGFGGPVIAGNHIYIMSGHSIFGLGMAGNVLLSFEVP
jgi:polyvinyl alcohol dehydrogenase (cytochrome)